MFVSRLTVNDKDPLRNCENLSLSIETQLSKKQETFSELFVPFLESPLNFKDFEEKMIVIANVFLKLQTVKYLVRPISKKPNFRTRFDSQHVKGSEILVEFAWEQFYHIFHHFEGKRFGKCLS